MSDLRKFYISHNEHFPKNLDLYEEQYAFYSSKI